MQKENTRKIRTRQKENDLLSLSALWQVSSGFDVFEKSTDSSSKMLLKSLCRWQES